MAIGALLLLSVTIGCSKKSGGSNVTPLNATDQQFVTKAGYNNVDEIDAATYWVSHLGSVEFGEEGVGALDKQRIHNSDRGRIQLIYMPATRDGNAVTRQALRQLLKRLERSGDFDDETKEEEAKE